MKKFTTSIALSVIYLSLASYIYSQTPIITTIAGNGYGESSGLGGYSGDGGPAIAAELFLPGGVAFDASANIYIADIENNVIRKVNTTGIISTFAGNGIASYSGDGGTATSAELNYPSGVAADAIGNIYIADANNNVIRIVNTSGIISTFAGNGVIGYYGDGGLATSAELYYPQDVAVNSSGNVYIADSYNNVIRTVNSSGIISTKAGNGTAGYSGDGGQATAAELYTPLQIKVNSLNTIYIADWTINVVRIVNTSGIISTIAGNGTAGYSGDSGPATSAELDGSLGVAVDDSGKVYIVDQNNDVIRMVNTSGIISTYAGFYVGIGFSGDGGPATLAELNNPIGVAVDDTGNLYIGDTRNDRVRKVKICQLAAPPGPIVGNVTICSGTSQSYSVVPVSGATGYSWTLPSGWSGSSTGTSITATVSANGGNISVSAINACGNSPSQTLSVTVQSPPNASICYVSVDTSSTYNEIFWDKSALDTLAIDSFQIYRQVLTNYVEVGSIAANAFPSFIDYGSTPNSNNSLYEIGVLDTCGEVGIDSVLHDQTILLQASLGVGNVVNLSWNAYIGATVNYYRILRDSTGTGNWQRLDSVSSSILAYTDLHPPVSNNLQYVITTDWNLSCIPSLAPIRHGLFYSLSSYSNRKKLVVTGVDGISDLSSAIEVYPNPVANTLFISINQPIDGNITILNVLGEEVYSDAFTSKNQNTTKQISLSGLSSGVYILKIESKGQTLVKKFVKM